MLGKLGSRSSAVRRAFWAKHPQYVRRLPKHKQALYHWRTAEAMHRELVLDPSLDPTGKKALKLIVAKVRLGRKSK
jgi:hypothetical protein